MVVNNSREQYDEREGDPISSDRRLNERAMSIGKALSQGFGKALSEIFKGGTVLK
ncbi:MAG: hypothetical protein PUP92_37530 [Rhizonema sp. PD38]|nr:hypothetical protein [Rhizonema sp. PD38]